MMPSRFWCGETDLQEELLGPRKYDTAQDSWNEEMEEKNTFRDIWSSEDLAALQDSRNYFHPLLTGNSEEEPETKQESMQEKTILDWTDLGNSENGEAEVEDLDLTWDESLKLFLEECNLNSSPNNSPLNSSSTTEESNDLWHSSSSNETPISPIPRYSFTAPQDAEKLLWSHANIQEPTGSRPDPSGLTITTDKMSSSMMISTVAGLASMLSADMWTVTSATLRSKEVTKDWPTQLVFLQLIPSPANGTTLRSTDSHAWEQ